MPGAADHDSEIDRLHELPLDEFTAARDGLAARLRRDGEADIAAEVKRLRKPSAAAWALNQVRRGDPDGVGELIEAGQRLREAQESVLAGGSRAALDEASAAERRLVTELVRHAERELVAAGRKVSSAIHERLRETLHAVATDPEAREGLAAGRLVRDHSPGAWPLGAAAAPRSGKKRKGKDPGAREAERVAGRLERARAKLAGLEREIGDARDGVREARADAARAASALERAEAAEEQAKRRAEKAGAEVEELAAALEEATSDR